MNEQLNRKIKEQGLVFLRIACARTRHASGNIPPCPGYAVIRSFLGTNCPKVFRQQTFGHQSL